MIGYEDPIVGARSPRPFRLPVMCDKLIINDTSQRLRRPHRRGEVPSPVLECYINSEVHYNLLIPTLRISHSERTH